MEMSKYKPGQFSWVDLMTPDVEKSKKFYAGLFGWTADDQTDPEGNYIYTMFQLGGKTVAGMGPQPESMQKMGVPPLWNSYVTVDDIDAITAKVEAAGGKVMAPKMQIFESGAMAVYADPTGAAFSVWQPQNHIGASLCNDPDTFCWNELNTPDMDKSKAFYTQVFPWEWKTEDAGGMPYDMIRLDGNVNGGAMKMEGPNWEGVPPSWTVYFASADIDETAAKVKALGGTVHKGPFQAGPGRMGVFADDQGAVFLAIQFAG